MKNRTMIRERSGYRTEENNRIRRTGRTAKAARSAAACLLLLALLLGIGQVLQIETAAAATAPDAVTIKSVKHINETLTIKWKSVEDCTGYQVQYAQDRLFMEKKSKRISDPDAVSATINGVSKGVTYYVRIRAYQTDEYGTEFSSWTLSANARQGKEITRTPVRKFLRKFELRRAIKEKVQGYDTVQGSCYGKGYAYFVMENRNKHLCKIAKVNLKAKKVVKVSAAMYVGHGNDMTYDTKRNRLVVAYSTPYPKMLAVVDPVSLEKLESRTVKLPKTIEGISKETLKTYRKNNYYTGFGAIAYNAAHDQYVVTLRGETFHHLMVLDSDFKPVRFIWLDKKTEMLKQMLQSMDSVGDYIMVAQSYGYGYRGNKILIYDWQYGDLLSTLDLGTTYELESIFHADGNMYAVYYTSFYRFKKLQRDNFIYLLSDL